MREWLAEHADDPTLVSGMHFPGSSSAEGYPVPEEAKKLYLDRWPIRAALQRYWRNMWQEPYRYNPAWIPKYYRQAQQATERYEQDPEWSPATEEEIRALVAKVMQNKLEKSSDLKNEYAPGIPKSLRKNPIPSLTRSKDWDYTLHEHKAERAGKHYDLRLGDGRRAYSWAVPKGLPKPGDKNLALRQPDHTVEYMDFKGEIEEGYGKGKVDIADRGKVRIVEAKPDQIKFVLTDKRDPEEFVLFRTGRKKDDWLLLNRTPTRAKRKDLPVSKPKYQEADPDTLQSYMDRRWAFQPKVDGAHVTVDFTQDHPRIFSYRESQRSDRLINHTYKAQVDNFKIPKELKGTQARGEIYGVDKKTGRSIPPNQLGAILNSTTENALKKLEDEGVELKTLLFDVIKFKNKDLEKKPYREKRKALQEINRKTPRQFEIPKQVTTPDAKLRLFDQIKKREHPATQEGVIAWDLDAPADRQPPVKLKIRPDYDVYVRNIYEGGGKYKGTHAGGFEYSLTPRGKIVGRVGTGFTDELRKDMWKNPKKYKGKAAKVTALDQYESGALRAPAFTGQWHLEKGKQRETGR